MYQSFESLSEDKRQKIIDICIEEFANNGYEKASTNAIVKNAGISKGALFHYFKNKKNLYLYVIDYTLDHFVKKFYEAKTDHSSDIFERLITWSINKLKMAHDYPAETKLLMEAFVDMPDELKPDLIKRSEKLYKDNLPVFFEGIDMSKFRESVSPEKAIELIMLCLEGLKNKYTEKYKAHPGSIVGDMGKILEEYKEYVDMLKYGVYKSDE